MLLVVDALALRFSRFWEEILRSKSLQVFLGTCCLTLQFWIVLVKRVKLWSFLVSNTSHPLLQGCEARKNARSGRSQTDTGVDVTKLVLVDPRRFPARHGGTQKIDAFYNGKIPNYKWMMTWGTPILGNLHVSSGVEVIVDILYMEHTWCIYGHPRIEILGFNMGI